MKTNTLNLMKRSTTLCAAALAAVAVTGCYNPNGTPNNTASGALAGGAFGAASGAIIGSASHSAGEGALIGAAAGTILGGLIGNSADQQQERLRQQYPATYNRAVQGTPLSVADVKALAKAGLNDDTIIAQINNSHTVYHLNATDIIDLHESGVSQRIITYMVDTATAISQAATSVTVAGPPPPAPAEVLTPAPGPGYLWTNGEWVWNGGWYWSAGYWAYPPYSGAIWIGGYWGPGPHGYIRYGGHWGRR
jgi:uncharacterized protein YcfJ